MIIGIKIRMKDKSTFLETVNYTLRKGASRDLIINKLVSEFDSHWVVNISCLMPN